MIVKSFLLGVMAAGVLVGCYWMGYDSGQEFIEYQCRAFRAFTYGRNAWSCDRLKKEEEPTGPKRPARDYTET